MSESASSSLYDLAYCYLLNGENLRCVELLENNELVYASLKFRILVGQALLNAGNVQACIRVLEKDPRDDNTMLMENPILTPEQRNQGNDEQREFSQQFQLG